MPGHLIYLLHANVLSALFNWLKLVNFVNAILFKQP